MSEGAATAGRLARARVSIEGLSVGDALGECFFSPWIRSMCLTQRQVPDGPWRWTDDTAMGMGIIRILERHGRIDQDELASEFARQYQREPDRGYGPAQHGLLKAIAEGNAWQDHSRSLFHGRGSFGNGAAMRAAPVGAFFADDLTRVAEEARLSAEVTHAHSDGIAGAIAVAVAAAWAFHWKPTSEAGTRHGLLQAAYDWTPDGATRKGLEVALSIGLDEWEFDVANTLGNGSHVTAADTVPFCLWAAAKHLDNYAEAVWTAIRVHGDIDTNCAIIGSIVVLAQGESGIPPRWQQSRERLPY